MDIIFKNGTPEEVGISSQDVRAFLKKLEVEGLYMHSVLIIRHGKLVAEGYYAPYTRATKHRMYSASKSFVSGAIGLLCDEGKLRLSDKVHTFFPEFPAEELHPYIREATVEDLLMMASPHQTTYSLDPAHPYGQKWAESFFYKPPLKPAGTVFRYDTSSSYILDVIVERVTGKPFLEYMKDKMLRRLGFSEDAFCIESPEGYSWGGSGVICTPLDLAKYAYVYLCGGKVGGEQLLSEEYAKAAISKQISNDTFGYSDMFRNVGYGYQIWCRPEGGFAFSGMGGQFVYGLPDKELLFVCTAFNQGRPDANHLIFDAFLNGIARRTSEKALPENKEAYAMLQKELSALSLYIPKGETHSAWEQKVQDVAYALEENPLGFQWVRFTFDGDAGVLHYENARGRKEIPFGLGKYKEIEFPEIHYSGRKIGMPRGKGYRCLAAAVWTDENRLLLRVNSIDDHLGNLGITFGFRDTTIGVAAEKMAEGFWHDYQGFAGGRSK